MVQTIERGGGQDCSQSGKSHVSFCGRTRLGKPRKTVSPTLSLASAERGITRGGGKTPLGGQSLTCEHFPGGNSRLTDGKKLGTGPLAV